MSYLNNLISLFTFLFVEGSKFVYLLGLVIVSGLMGGLVSLIKRFIHPLRKSDE